MWLRRDEVLLRISRFLLAENAQSALGGGLDDVDLKGARGKVIKVFSGGIAT